MHANETQARAYLTEVTGLVLGRVVSNFPHRIEFSCAALPPSDQAELQARVAKWYPEMVQHYVGLENRCTVSPGKVIFFKEHSVGLAQALEPSANLEHQIRRCWQAIAEEGLDVSNNSEAIELCLDADRMSMFGGEGGKRADAELDALTAMFGYEKVDKVLCQKVRLV